DFFNHRIVDTSIDDCSRTGRALLALKSERCLHDTRGRLFEISILSHNDGVFASHLSNYAFDPELTVVDLGRAFIDAQANFLRAREGDETRLRVIDHHVPNFSTRTCHEINYASGHSGFFEQFEELVSNCWSVR